MKKVFTILIALFILQGASTVEAAGTTYYVCDTGNDSNSGLSQASPWKTFSKAQTEFKTLNAGDTMAFCRGGQFGGSFSPPRNAWVNYNCRASNKCTISDYGNSSLPAPVITNTADGIFKFEDSGNSDHDEGYLIENLTLKGGGSGFGIVIYNDADDIIMDNLTIDNFDIGVYISTANAPAAGSNGKNERITLKNSRILNNSGQGLLGSGDSTRVLDNNFENNGFGKAVFNHNIYLGGKSVVKDVIVAGNTLYKSAVINGSCSGVSLVVHGLYDGLTIENNHVYEDPNTASGYCWGIAVDPGYSMEESFKNVTIKGNLVENVGGNGIGCASCDGLTIEDNVITDVGDTLWRGINVPDRQEDSVKTDNVLIKNNFIAISTPVSNMRAGIEIGGNGSVSMLDNVMYVKDTNKECLGRNGSGTLSENGTQCLSAGSSLPNTPSLSISYKGKLSTGNTSPVNQTNTNTNTEDEDEDEDHEDESDEEEWVSDEEEGHEDEDESDTEDESDEEEWVSDEEEDVDTEEDVDEEIDEEKEVLISLIESLTAQIVALQEQLLMTISGNNSGDDDHKFVSSHKNGDEDQDVLKLQKKLNRLGFNVAPSGLGSINNETTYFGPKTIDAIKKFQCHYDIVCEGDPETTGYGNLGSQTRDRLNAI